VFLKHFHLRAEPFAVAADPAFFYPGPEHREALASLYYVVLQRRGCGLMAAGSGLGKTVVLNCLREQIANFADVIFLHGPMNGGELIDSMIDALAIRGVSVDGGRYRQLRAIERVLFQKARTGRRTVLMIDSAELLHAEAIDSLQTLVALETKEGKLLDVLLAAQPALVNLLRAPRFERLRQSIDVSCCLAPLDEKGTEEYLWHRVVKAGSKKTLFTREAAELLAAATRGNPRRINQLAHQALAAAWAHDSSHVDEEIMWGVLYDVPLPDLVEWGHALSAGASQELMVVNHA
jgi:general secretion pathway protein A